MDRLQQLLGEGQAVWLDYTKRSFTASGELARLVQRGVRGVTSNPTIFEKAIIGSTEYDDVVQRLSLAGLDAVAIYEALTVEDIAAAADVLRPVYDATHGADGFVSLEVSPTLAHDTAGTVAAATRLFAALDRPNVMIKIPGTAAGVPAIEESIAAGININVTLLFSLANYEAIALAYIKGLERRVAAGEDIAHLHSVASFFVSRVDTAVDKALASVNGAAALLGTVAVANAKVAYARYQQLFSGPRWTALAAKGARVQRPLWASTSTKNKAYSDVMYVDQLIGPDTINTMPVATLEAFIDHGTIAPTLTRDLDGARAVLASLAAMGVDLNAVTAGLLEEGVESFTQSFVTLLAGIEAKRAQYVTTMPRDPVTQKAVAGMASEEVPLTMDGIAGSNNPEYIIPVKVYRGDDRITIAAPMPGMEVSGIVVTVMAEHHVVLDGKRGGLYPGETESLMDEWNPGPYHRDLEVPDSVDGERANVTYSNGVLVVSLPIVETTREARLTLTALSATHGERFGESGHPDDQPAAEVSDPSARTHHHPVG
ncbi:MAG: transaldolase [Dehalococcoidia bacterium]